MKIVPYYYDVGEKANWAKRDLSSDRDCDVVVYQNASSLAGLPFADAVAEAAAIDGAIHKEIVFVAMKDCHGGRLVLAPTGDLEADVDDVRVVAEVAAKAIGRAAKAGAKHPVLRVTEDIIAFNNGAFSTVAETCLLSSMGQFHLTHQASTTGGSNPLKEPESIHLATTVAKTAEAERLSSLLWGIEVGRRVARDIGTADPEVMSPINAAAYVEKTFEGSGVRVTVLDDIEMLKTEYPCLMAVARASLAVPRHHPRVVRLEYRGDGPAETNLLFAGKGIVYDTGGNDVKTGGHMQGMSRDKYGAASVAGFFKTLATLKPARVHAVAELGFVRNSVGADGYVADEVIRSHAGVRVQVCNTDAEGRMILCDMLSHLREKSAEMADKNKCMFSVATLTGHALLTYGPYTAIVENAVARNRQVGAALRAAGERCGDFCEHSTLRSDDFKFIKPDCADADVKQGNNLPSVATKRGHQFPAAFLLTASGLRKHNSASAQPIPYAHLDIAGSIFTDEDAAAPIAALAYTYC